MNYETLDAMRLPWHANTCAVEEVNAKGVDVMDCDGKVVGVVMGSFPAKLLEVAPLLLSACDEVVSNWQALERKYLDGKPESEYVKGVRHGYKNAAAMLKCEMERIAKYVPVVASKFSVP